MTRHRATPGFTLVELLVVVTIIVMLLALLSPALENAKAVSYRVKCLTNLHAIGGAQTLYFLDHKHRFTMHYVNTWGTAVIGALGDHGYDAGNAVDSDARVLNRYLGYTGKGARTPVAECPSDIGDQMYNTTAISYPLYQAIGTSYLPTYGTHSGVEYTDGWVGDAGVPARPCKKLTRIATNGDGERHDNKIIWGDWTFWGNRALTYPTTQRHCDNAARRSNLLFADMHAEWFFFDNDLIDYGSDPNNITRPPSPSFYWW